MDFRTSFRYCHLHGQRYDTKFELWGHVNDSEGKSLFTRRAIFEIGFSTLVLLNAYTRIQPDIEGVTENGERKDIPVWEITSENLLETANRTFVTKGVAMNDRTIINMSARIVQPGQLNVRVWVVSNNRDQSLNNDLVWVAHNDENPGNVDWP